jgi:hypothetical protein
MLSSLPPSPLWAHDLPEECKKAIAEREGEWELVTEEPCAEKWYKRLIARISGTSTTRITTLVLTEKEFSKLFGTGKQHLMARAKQNVMQAGVNIEADGLWRTGSTEHVGLKLIAPELVLRCLTGAHTERRRSTLMFWRKARARTYFRVRKKKDDSTGLTLSQTIRQETNPDTAWVLPRPTTQSGGNGSGNMPTGSTAPPNGGGSGPSSSSGGPSASSGDGEPRPQIRDQAQATVASVHEENSDLVLQERHGRFVVEEIGGTKVHVILGQDFDKDAPRTRAPRVGVMTGPMTKEPHIYTDSEENVEDALENRLTQKFRPCTFTQQDKDKLKKFVGNAVGTGKFGLFSPKKIDAWFRKNFDYQGWKSKKWSDLRMQQAVEQLLQQVEPKFKLKTMIKAEDMPENKPPRFLIADGDMGQVMALAVIKCMEELLFEAMEQHSIKHAGKREAMDRMLGHMRPPLKRLAKGYVFVEGDGAAWDTTCNHTVRECIENPIVSHIGKVLDKIGIVPACWNRAHEEVNSARMYKLKFENKHNKKVGRKVAQPIEVDAIRRSGHRGTSVLNWWVNFSMWVCSTFEEPWRFLDPEIKTGRDVAGVDRWFFGAFEGDDSGVSTSPKMISVSAEDRQALRDGSKAYKDLANEAWLVSPQVVQVSAAMLDFWERGGFNMKLVFPQRRATMVGYHIELHNANGSTAPTGLCCPELPRGVAKNYTTSAAMREAVRNGDIKTIKRIAAAANLAKAADYAGILPTVSRKYKEYADTLESGDYDDREMAMHIGGVETMSAEDVRDKIDLQNASVSANDEDRTLRRLVYGATDDELTAYRKYPWHFEVLGDFDGYFRSLPKAWRIGGSV